MAWGRGLPARPHLALASVPRCSPVCWLRSTTVVRWSSPAGVSQVTPRTKSAFDGCHTNRSMCDSPSSGLKALMVVVQPVSIHWTGGGHNPGRRARFPSKVFKGFRAWRDDGALLHPRPTVRRTPRSTTVLAVRMPGPALALGTSETTVSAPIPFWGHRRQHRRTARRCRRCPSPVGPSAISPINRR